MKHIPLFVVIVLTVAGCTTSPPEGLAFLPKLEPPPAGFDQIRLTGRSTGTLKVVRGCVRVALDRSPGFTTVLWHPGTELHRDRFGYFLRNADTGSVYRFGERIDFGGGTSSRESIEQHYPDIAERCGPPYASGWLPN